jgi:hypothetical protein
LGLTTSVDPSVVIRLLQRAFIISKIQSLGDGLAAAKDPGFLRIYERFRK